MGGDVKSYPLEVFFFPQDEEANGVGPSAQYVYRLGMACSKGMLKYGEGNASVIAFFLFSSLYPSKVGFGEWLVHFLGSEVLELIFLVVYM